ncbi:hypothetical protein NEAUS03_2312, partial [Nematocida ausubeli]
YLNNAIGWIRTNITQNSSLKIVYTVPFFILASLLLGMTMYSIVMIIGLLRRDSEFSFSAVVFVLSSLVVRLLGVFVVKYTLYILIMIARDLWNRKTKGNIISILGIILCTVMAFAGGIIYPCPLNVHTVEASLSWMILFLLTIFAFIAYALCFNKKIKKEMHNQERVPELIENIELAAVGSIFMIISIILIYFTQPSITNNLSVRSNWS